MEKKLHVVGISGSARADGNTAAIIGMVFSEPEKAGEVFADDDGVRNMHNLGENMAWLLQTVGKTR